MLVLIVIDIDKYDINWRENELKNKLRQLINYV